MLQSHSEQTNENYLFSKILYSFVPSGDQIFLILYCLKKPVTEREYI